MIVESSIANEAGVAKEIADGKLWDVHVKAKVDQSTKEVDCAQTCKEVSRVCSRVTKKM